MAVDRGQSSDDGKPIFMLHIALPCTPCAWLFALYHPAACTSQPACPAKPAERSRVTRNSYQFNNYFRNLK